MGNLKTYNIEGQKFGRLLVLVEDAGRNHTKLVMSECQCDCGNTVTISRARLMSGHTKSCGCLNSEKATDRINTARDLFYSSHDYTDGALGSVYQYYKRNAKRRGLVFDLTRAEFIGISQQPCDYCGTIGSMSKDRPSGEVSYNGIDRVDNDSGYVLRNVVSCCKNCNTAKGAMTTDEFKQWISIVYEHLNLK